MRSSGGFTLIELLAVAVIVSIIAAAVAVKVSQPHGKALLEHTISEFVFLDQQIRHHARRTGKPSGIAVDLRQGDVSQIGGDGARRRRKRLRRAAGVRVDRAVVDGRERNYGRFELFVSANGHSKSYAVRFHGPARDEQWLIVSGLTGQSRRTDDVREVRRLLLSDPTAASRVHAR